MSMASPIKNRGTEPDSPSRTATTLDSNTAGETDEMAARQVWHNAAEHGDVEYLRSLANPALLNCRDTSGSTAVMNCVRLGHTACLQYLIDAGCDLDIQDSYGTYAAELAIHYLRVDMLRMLIDAGCDINRRDRAHRTAAIYATEQKSIDMLRMLIDSGCDLEAADILGNTPLTLAAKEGSVKCLSLLVQAGANIHARTIYGVSATEHAAKHTTPGLAAQLLSILDARAMDLDIFVPLTTHPTSTRI